jgi:hypothetical protein
MNGYVNMSTLMIDKPYGQRQVMRYLARKYGRHNQNRIINEYAKAEVKGYVKRKSNRLRRTPLEYAYMLYADMMTKGW